jgi:TrwC relaxase
VRRLGIEGQPPPSTRVGPGPTSPPRPLENVVRRRLICTEVLGRPHDWSSASFDPLPNGAPLLSVAKLSPGQEGYYAASVADGFEDYYAGRGEAPGIWHGAGAVSLGLSGVVPAEGLRAIVRAVDPATGCRRL